MNEDKIQTIDIRNTNWRLDTLPFRSLISGQIKSVSMVSRNEVDEGEFISLTSHLIGVD